MSHETARLWFAGVPAPVALDGAERTTYGKRSELAGWAVPGGPSGDLCLVRAEHAGQVWSVADVSVDVSYSGHGDRPHVSVTWRTGWELPALHGDASGNVRWLLRAQTLGLVDTDELVDMIGRYAVAVAGGLQTDCVRRLAVACNELHRRNPFAERGGRPAVTAEDGPVRLMQEVMTAGGHRATTAGELRARLDGADLGGLCLSTLPRDLPNDPAAAVLLVNSLADTLGLLRAAEDLAAEEKARMRARLDGAPAPAAVAGAAYDAVSDTLTRRCTAWARRPVVPPA
ncbi:hypothetical protein ABZ508_35445 [Streptomyces lavendulocolor]|uniref:Uncharacterized protein n=1 Tax=Streptomyces lavendulocolor TaxID=67316 RepID=A0ABV2WH28_9ACTN